MKCSRVDGRLIEAPVIEAPGGRTREEVEEGRRGEGGWLKGVASRSGSLFCGIACGDGDRRVRRCIHRIIEIFSMLFCACVLRLCSFAKNSERASTRNAQVERFLLASRAGWLAYFPLDHDAHLLSFARSNPSPPVNFTSPTASIVYHTLYVT